MGKFTLYEFLICILTDCSIMQNYLQCMTETEIWFVLWNTTIKQGYKIDSFHIYSAKNTFTQSTQNQIYVNIYID